MWDKLYGGVITISEKEVVVLGDPTERQIREVEPRVKEYIKLCMAHYQKRDALSREIRQLEDV